MCMCQCVCNQHHTLYSIFYCEMGEPDFTLLRFLKKDPHFLKFSLFLSVGNSMKDEHVSFSFFL